MLQKHLCTPRAYSKQEVKDITYHYEGSTTPFRFLTIQRAEGDSAITCQNEYSKHSESNTHMRIHAAHVSAGII